MGPSVVVLAVDVDDVRAAVPRVRALLADGCDVQVRLLGGPDTAADLAVVDAMARLVLCSRHCAGALRLQTDVPDLRRLVELAGLSDVLLV